MAAEPNLLLLFDLFDSYWFTHQLFTKTQNPPPRTPQFNDPVPETTQNQNLDFSAFPTINVRCHSDQMLISSKQHKFIISDSPKLATVFSGKEAKEIEEKEMKLRRGRVKRNNLMRCKSKSLSELEFEEVKGFMDLGFLFSEDDKDSRLVSMIPGLQRLGKEGHVDGDVNVSRPYLSEAWGDLDLEKTRVKIPVVGDESEMKHQIRFWAHSVAAVVR
ncbi:hypothetical protein SSX86_033190 [Deinandra increscens subsp. villosa]|uniref:Uncharacterized protein n=1 Tax=Deinandra increscens subsp. villosa TaxID=3103831 RepID=A0AAP0GG58_9ASTR